MKRKLGAMLLVVALVLALALPAAPVAAATLSMTVVSDTSTEVTAVNNVPVVGSQYALYAWEPGPSYPNDGPDDSAWQANSLWDQGLTGHTFSANADWIWESYRVVLPVAGDVVDFQKTFYIPGVPTSGDLYITCDNGYEVWVNGNGAAAPIGMSAQVGAGWRTSDLTQSYVDTNFWQSVESWDISGYLQPGWNTIDIYAANEQMNGATQSSNPGGLIYEIDIEYEIPDIDKTVTPASGTLGDWLTVTLDVENPYNYSLTVEDTIPSGLGYIPGTLYLDSTQLTDPVGNTISVTIPAGPGDYTVTFDVQVVETPSPCDGPDIVTNTAYLKDDGDVLDQDSEDITINPYEDFEKTATLVYEEWVNGTMEVGELLQWDMTISFINPLGVPINATIYDRLGGDLGMAGDLVDNDRDGPADEGIWTGVIWTDRGDLSGAYNSTGTGILSFFKIKGKTNKVQYSITDGIGGSATVVYTLGIFTDHNPAKQAPGKQEYTTDGRHWLNSGAVIKFIDPGTLLQLSAHTCSLYVDVVYPD